jgi:hypothetical protein
MNEKSAAVKANSDAVDSETSLTSSNRSRNAKSKYAEIQVGNGVEMAQRVCMHMLTVYMRLEDECAAATDGADGGRSVGQLPQHLFFAAASEFNTGAWVLRQCALLRRLALFTRLRFFVLATRRHRR